MTVIGNQFPYLVTTQGAPAGPETTPTEAKMSGQLPPTPSPMKHPVRDPLESAGEARSSLVS